MRGQEAGSQEQAVAGQEEAEEQARLAKMIANRPT